MTTRIGCRARRNIACRACRSTLRRTPAGQHHGLVLVFGHPGHLRRGATYPRRTRWFQEYPRRACQAPRFTSSGQYRRSGLSTSSRRRAIAARFRRLLDAHFKEHWSVEAYAAALGGSPLGLRRACVDATGRSPSRLARERIVLEAQRSLAYSNRGIAQIGFSLGYQDPAYFSRVFGRHVGLSPQAYRRRIAREGSGAP